jgi:methyltransferase-like protein/2-polyprenyl-3-methyl-5-hydroxy-6-metoxy-1,4-benzoquinol methylase
MTSFSYDKIPYTKYIYQQTQPNTLATLATLFGMQPPAVETCRVLELGCATGINLMAMAQAIPQGEFIGVDLSTQQIEEGQCYLAQLALNNVFLKQMNILEIDERWGKFDYIVAHGVYSWVPIEVRDKILQICQCLMQPNGVAYVSYNTYPGWHVDRMLREMMMYRTKCLTSPHAKLESAKALLQFFQDQLKQKFDSYSLLLRNELHHISQLDENYLVHEYLEDYNEPVFFHEFIEHAQQYFMQYITDTKTPFIAIEPSISPEMQDFDLIEREQYMDFLRNTPFRETLLCHQEIVLQRQLEPEKISEFYLAAALKPANSTLSSTSETAHLAKQVDNNNLEKFNNLAGATVVSVSSPFFKVLLLYLGEIWPQSVSFHELIQKVTQSLNMLNQPTVQWPVSSDDIRESKEMFLNFYLNKLVELSVYPPQFTLVINDYPVASPIARLQSQQGKLVTNLRYEVLELNLMTRLIIRHLDGSHDRVALAKMLHHHIEMGELILYRDEEKQSLLQVEAEELTSYLAMQVKQSLHYLANQAFLIGYF